MRLIAKGIWNIFGLVARATGSLTCAILFVLSLVLTPLAASAQINLPPASVYGISKVALLGLTTTLARELGRDGINVNAIAPGMTMSDAGKTLTPEGSPFVTMVEAQAVIRARGEPDDLVGALLLLCSKAGAWMSGQVLHVDGGFIVRP